MKIIKKNSYNYILNKIYNIISNKIFLNKIVKILYINIIV